MTRDRILRAAVDLIFTRGVTTTTLDDVRTASGTSKSQLYRHFPDKESLVRAVIDQQARELLGHQQQQLQRLNSVRGLERWRDTLLQNNALHKSAQVCRLGYLASELGDRDDKARRALALHFEAWGLLLASGLERMRASGVLRMEADPRGLATGLIGALQGGYLLAQTARDVTPMKVALDMAIDYIRMQSQG
jgi:AcrR family transcriptional regulator